MGVEQSKKRKTKWTWPLKKAHLWWWSIEPEMSVYIFVSVVWHEVWYEITKRPVWKSSRFQPGSSPTVPSHRVPAASGTAVPRCSGASRYHLSFQVKQTLKSQPLVNWWLLMLLEKKPGTSRKPKETCSSHSMYEHSFSSLKQAFIRTRIFSFQALSGPMHVRPLEGFGNGFGKCVAPFGVRSFKASQAETQL